MPNPGGVYLGCSTCRRRKIKCDKKKPECSRCMKYGTQCPGYPDEHDVRFRHLTTRTMERTTFFHEWMSSEIYLQGEGSMAVTTSSVGKTQNYEVDLPERSSDLPQPFSEKSDILAPTSWSNDQILTRQSVSLLEWIANSRALSSSLNLPNATILTCYFFDQVLLPVGWFSYLPELYQRSLYNSCLRLTTTAASMFLAANQFKDERLLGRARILYSTALRKLNDVVSDPRQSLQDETLCSILLLNVLDETTGQKSFLNVTHLNGCAQLLRLREKKGIRSAYTKDLVHSVVIQTQAQAVQIYEPEDDFLKQWLHTQAAELPAAAIYKSCLEIGRLSAFASKLFASCHDQYSSLDESLLSLIHEANEIDSMMKIWYVAGGTRWNYGTAILKSSTGQETFAYYYSDLQVAKVWNQYRTARIILHEIIIDAAKRLDEFSSTLTNDYMVNTMHNSKSIIKSMLDDICISIPFHLQKVDLLGRQCSPRSQQVLGGCALVWPLEEVLRCKWSEQDHIKLAHQALYEIVHVLGVRQALASALRVERHDVTLQAD